MPTPAGRPGADGSRPGSSRRWAGTSGSRAASPLWPHSYRQLWNGGDAGDNILYPKVELNVTNTFVGRALCVKGTRTLWTNIYRNFVPRKGKTIWV
jgi:hypothetical protein